MEFSNFKTLITIITIKYAQTYLGFCWPNSVDTQIFRLKSAKILHAQMIFALETLLLCCNLKVLLLRYSDMVCYFCFITQAVFNPTLSPPPLAEAYQVKIPSPPSPLRNYFQLEVSI